MLRRVSATRRRAARHAFESAARHRRDRTTARQRATPFTIRRSRRDVADAEQRRAMSQRMRYLPRARRYYSEFMPFHACDLSSFIIVRW